MPENFTERLKTFADAFEMYKSESRSLSVAFENDRLTEIRQGESSGVSVRAVKSGKIGFSYSSKVDEIEDVAKSAARMAPFGKPYNFEFAGKQASKEKLAYDEGCENLNVEQLVELGNKVKDAIKAIDKDAMAECSFSGSTSRTRVATSGGQDCEERGSGFGYMVGAKVCEEGNFVQTYRYRNDNKRIDDKEIIEAARIAAQDLVIARNVSPFAEGKYRVLFSPSAVSDLMLPVGTSVNGLNIEKKTSRFVNSLGEKLFDDRFSVTDDPFLPDGPGSSLYDGEGVCTRRRAVVEKGVLKGFTHSLSTAKACGHEATGNAARGVSSIPQPSMHNIVVAAGDKSQADLLKLAEGGLLVDQMLGTFTSNFLAGQVSGNISLGFPIKDGKRTGRVKNCALNVNMFEMLKAGIVAISREREWQGNMLLPWILLEGVGISAR
ncbi:MAG: TldD/PmbA family protein [Planctomycetes bacterium]|nr:TldD/PmbA family protein [Planctomycetota bacterium]